MYNHTTRKVSYKGESVCICINVLLYYRKLVIYKPKEWKTKLETKITQNLGNNVIYLSVNNVLDTTTVIVGYVTYLVRLKNFDAQNQTIP